MIYGSVCSGIEAATVAWEPLGWKASFFSEIEKFPRAVLEHHYPDIPLHGDFTTIQEEEYEPIELLVGGTPCQSFSVAGLRKGLDDDRGNLALEYLRLAQRLNPRWLVWENVPGVLSSSGGRDFGSFLGALVELGYGFSYRVLDAQYFGVPQRRRRVFVVGYLGDWRPPAAVLFERHSLQGNTPPSREKREGAAGDVREGTHYRYQNEQAGIVKDDIAATVRRESSTTDERSVPAYVVHGTQDPCVGDQAFALGQENGQENVVAFTQNDGGRDASKEVCPTLRSGGDGGIPQASVAYENHPSDSRIKEMGETCSTVSARRGTGGGNVPLAQQAMQVRRLTPVECERLQGFPDNYTRIQWRGKDPENCPDGPRYKALGNSMAVPVMNWLGRRIEAANKLI